MRTILIGTSKFGNPVSDYYHRLGGTFMKNNYKVIYIFDGLFYDYPKESKNLKYHTWPSKRPTQFKDFVFLSKLIYKYKPVLCISNFGSTNVMSIVSWLFGVKNRMNYIHTTSVQLNIDSKKSFLYNRLLHFRKKLVLKLNTGFLTNSNGTKLDAINSFNIKKSKISVFPLLLNKSNIPYCKRSERSENIIIVGRLSPSKGHKELLIQFKDCIRKYPDLVLKIVGSGILLNELLILVKQLDITKNVEFLGNVPNALVNDLFSSSLIGVSSSKDEAYGLVNIEALREGTPIICTVSAGSKDIVIENRNGLFFDNFKKKSLLKSIEIVNSNWDAYSKGALECFNEEYNFENNILKHFKKLQNIIN